MKSEAMTLKGENVKPTSALRFIEKRGAERTYRILQQMVEVRSMDTGGMHYEWRDVPVVK